MPFQVVEEVDVRKKLPFAQLPNVGSVKEERMRQQCVSLSLFRYCFISEKDPGKKGEVEDQRVKGISMVLGSKESGGGWGPKDWLPMDRVLLI